MEIDWLKQFKGPFMHSMSYRDPRLFYDKHVVIIGIGNSALDISMDLCSASSKVTVCSNGANILPVYDDKKCAPADHELLRFVYVSVLVLFLALQKKILFFFFRSPQFASLRGRDKLARFTEMGRETTQHFVDAGMPFSTKGRLSILKNARRYIHALKTKQIVMRHSVDHVKDEKTLILRDGSEIDDVDCVIICTGYHIDFSFLSEDLNPLVKNKFPNNQGLYFFCSLFVFSRRFERLLRFVQICCSSHCCEYVFRWFF